MNIEQLIAAFKNPQAAISLLSALVAGFGAVGIFSTDLTGALQAVLTAVLAVLVALGHTGASTALVRRAARKAAPRAVA